MKLAYYKRNKKLVATQKSGSEVNPELEAKLAPFGFTTEQRAVAEKVVETGNHNLIPGSYGKELVEKIIQGAEVIKKFKSENGIDSQQGEGYNKVSILGELDWDKIKSKKGESRIDHINKHSVPNHERASHGVFNGNPKDIVESAWRNRGNIEPIDDGMGGEIYNIPFKNSGYESGYINTGAQMNYVTIIVIKGTNHLIAAFPSFGTYTN